VAHNSRTGGSGGERGQALIEAALVIPVLLLVAFGVVMAGRVVHAKIAVQAAAREASREVATATSEGAGVSEAIQTAQSVADGYGLSQDRLSVEIDANGFQRGETVTATVHYDVGLGDLPLLGRAGVSVTSSHTERIELYRSRGAVHQ
jgi:Flp pilus assembly protein TadG